LHLSANKLNKSLYYLQASGLTCPVTGIGWPN
jgi:hypothetical protein